MRTGLILIVGLAFLLSASAAAAMGEAGHEEIVAHIFEMADLDGSGSLDADEYEEAGLAKYGVSFADCDADEDGETSLREYLDLYRRHHSPAGGQTA
ncbi:MAG: hypothetical protein ACPGVZ_20285 [Myxococcota bacterium]